MDNDYRCIYPHDRWLQQCPSPVRGFLAGVCGREVNLIVEKRRFGKWTAQVKMRRQRWHFSGVPTFYEKVVKVKGDVASVLAPILDSTEVDSARQQRDNCRDSF
jgi:hypothetical protein